MNNRSILEAILFVAEQPVPAPELAEVLEIPVDEVEAELEAWAADLAARPSGIQLRRIAGGWRLYSHPDAFPYLERFASTATAGRLSSAALEVLAVVAYRQPVSRSQIAEIRGVDSDSAIRTLERRGLIEEVGRLPLPGTPTIYGTTDLFLEEFGLDSLDDLPDLKEFEDLLEERYQESLMELPSGDGPEGSATQDAPDPGDTGAQTTTQRDAGRAEQDEGDLEPDETGEEEAGARGPAGP